MVGARNVGLDLARGQIAIFLDDDVIPHRGLVEAHLAAYDDPRVGGVAGRILDQGHEDGALPHPKVFDPQDGWRHAHFDHAQPGDVMTSRGCNMSFRRELLMRLRGFDGRLQMWRDDTDMCFRVRDAGYAIRFVPAASLMHLASASGGTRPGQQAPSAFAGELRMYRTHYRHYRDNLYFLAKHLGGAEHRRAVLEAYRDYVGLSRWPWRLLAKNGCFAVALGRAYYWVVKDSLSARTSKCDGRALPAPACRA
jgi:GT2 family glycosyltransferase